MTHHHTPGPWKVTDRFEISVDDGDVQPLIATVNADSTSVSEEQAEADARLIAAAPLLLAALQSVRNILYAIHHDYAVGGADIEDGLIIADEALAAITALCPAPTPIHAKPWPAVSARSPAASTRVTPLGRCSGASETFGVTNLREFET